MNVSASPLESHLDCNRQPWFKNVREMPEWKVIKGAEFGTALHSVTQRFRQQDDQGRGPELYPKGWNDGLDASDAQLLKMLVTAAVDSGHLRRTKGRKAEEWVDRPIIVNDDVVRLTGKMDCEDDDGVEDDKTTSAAKWALDTTELARDPAMLFYAVEWFKRHRDAEVCKLRLNYYLKDKTSPKTWPVEIFVTKLIADTFERDVMMPAIREMMALASANLTDEQWEQVPGPRTQDVCRKFGGCQYATICGKVETPAQYRARVQRVLSNKTPKETTVGIFAKPASATQPTVTDPNPTVVAAIPATMVAPAKTGIFARKASASASAAPATPAAAPAPAPAPKVAEPTVGATPWAHAGCRACKGTGMHPTEKRPCRGCRSTRMALKLPTDESFNVGFSEAGDVTWTPKEGGAAGAAPAIAPVTDKKQEVVPVVTAPPEPKPERKPRGKKQPEVAADVVEAVAATADAPLLIEPEMKAVALPFILLCHAAPEKVSGLQALSMADVFREASEAVGKASGSDYWSLNAFERRDALVKMAPQLAARLRGHVLIAPRSTPDQDALVQALKPYATLVVAGLS